MHKICLTATECGIIRGADKIIDTIGMFPSMEDGELIDVHLAKNSSSSRGFVSLTFDITGWRETVKQYLNQRKMKDFSQSKIRIVFSNALDVSLNDPLCAQGEIKFGNSHNKALLRQDEDPYNTPVIGRPFCIFCVRDSRNVVIEFEEEECEIRAELLD